MSTTKSTSNGGIPPNGKENSGARSGPPKFVQYRLSDDEIATAKEAAVSDSDVAQIIDQVVSEGYKFSASHDNYGGGVQVFLTPGNPDDPNFGWTLSSRGPSLQFAVGMMCWKHYTLFSGVWPKEIQGGSKTAWG